MVHRPTWRSPLAFRAKYAAPLRDHARIMCFRLSSFVARSSSSAGRCDSCELQHADLTQLGRVSRACAARDRERGPEVGRWKVNVLSAFQRYHSWNHPSAECRPSAS